MTRFRVRDVTSMPAWLSSREFPGREPRVRVNMCASVQVTPERSVIAQIVDLSRSGFRLISEEPLQTGQLVELSNRKRRDPRRDTLGKWPRSGGSVRRWSSDN